MPVKHCYVRYNNSQIKICNIHHISSLFMDEASKISTKISLKRLELGDG